MKTTYGIKKNFLKGYRTKQKKNSDNNNNMKKDVDQKILCKKKAVNYLFTKKSRLTNRKKKFIQYKKIGDNI